MKPQPLKTLAALGFAVASLSVYAEQGGKGMEMGNMKMDCSRNMEDRRGMDCMGQGSAKAGPAALTDAEVKSVDAAASHVTLKHGPIENMKMPAMTMAFTVQDKSVLSNLKEGSKVKFAVENVNGVPTVTSLIPQQ